MTTDTNQKEIARYVSGIFYTFLMNCSRAFLLSVCVSLLLPTFNLTFWQWWLISYTVRLFVTPVVPHV